MAPDPEVLKLIQRLHKALGEAILDSEEVAEVLAILRSMGIRIGMDLVVEIIQSAGPAQPRLPAASAGKEPLEPASFNPADDDFLKSLRIQPVEGEPPAEPEKPGDKKPKR